MPFKLAAALLALLLLTSSGRFAQAVTPAAQESEKETDSEPLTIEEATKDYEAFPGFFTFYWDSKQGKIWLQVDRWDDFLYVQSLATGLGSNPVGLDRGQLGTERVVSFKRVGPRVLLEQKNLRYRARSENVAEQQAVAESFATSVLAGFEVAAEGPEGNVLIDLTAFLLADAHDVVGTLKSTDQGSFSLDAERSYLFLPRTKSFPQNCEFEAALTFASSEPGPLVNETAASAKEVTLRQHRSFIKLPDAGYQPRAFDPRVGAFKLSFADYATDIGEPLWQHRITRHRLQKQTPGREPSAPVEPIVYYVDPGAPPEIKQALIEGASWWNAAFETAGFVDAFQVRELPSDADPLDVRYNVIQWVHRSTRGWSYGQSVVDPRTGEIIKGHVLLGSLRVHQDHLLMRGLLDTASGKRVPRGCDCCGASGLAIDSVLTLMAQEEDPTEVALARIRQLSAHEVGHTLGFAHNFAASTYGDRASVMDYPAPRVNITDEGQLDLSDAYGVGVGVWDHFTVNYAYREFDTPAAEGEGLKAMVDQAIENGWLYISDPDARPAGAAHPLASLWDNGSDPIAQLEHDLRVRQIGLESFDASKLAPGSPRADLENLLVPLYLHHRYQVEATAKMLGGAYYNYGVAGDQLPGVQPVPVPQQQQALEVLLRSVEPSELVIPAALLQQLPPKSFSSLQDRERFSSRTDPLFDPLAAAETAAQLTIHAVLQPQRLARLESQAQAAWDPGQVMQRLVQSTWEAPLPADDREAAVQRVVQRVVLDRLLQLASDPNISPAVSSQAELQLKGIMTVLAVASQRGSDSLAEEAHVRSAFAKINRFLSRPAQPTTPAPELELPPGSPIGGR